MMPDDPERVVREVTFAVEGDGRTIEARIVPYNTDTQVVDAPHNGGTGIPYVERWIPGAFEKQVSAAHRVWLNVEHEPGFRAVVGHGIALRESPDALYGEFRVEPGVDGDKALHMVNEGVLTGLSVEAIPRTTRTVGGIVERVKATLDKVSLVREGLAAYSTAQVIAVREAPPEIQPPAPNETDELLQRLGFTSLPTRKVSRKPWNAARSRFTDEQYEASCLVPGMLPVLEPNGDVNVEALGQALNRLNSVTSGKNEAARKLVRYYRLAGLDVPKALRTIAAR